MAKKSTRRKAGWFKDNRRHRLAAYKGVRHQTGKSVKEYDLMYKAQLPGRRRSAKGKTYYEYRKNRSDWHGKL